MAEGKDMMQYFSGFLYNQKCKVDLTNFANLFGPPESLADALSAACSSPDDFVSKLSGSDLRSFCRGYVDQYGSLWKTHYEDWELDLHCCDQSTTNAFSSLGIVCQERSEGADPPVKKLIYTGSNCFDILALLYDGTTVYDASKNPLPLTVITEVTGVTTNQVPLVKIVLEDPKAVMPHKKRPSDIGYDLTIIKISEVFESGVTMFDTGVCIQPANGWYAQIVPRSSFCKKGWVMVNSLGIIDRGYIGTVKVPLLRFVLHPHVHSLLKQVSSLIPTERAANGFGSTDSKRGREPSDSENDCSGKRKKTDV